MLADVADIVGEKSNYLLWLYYAAYGVIPWTRGLLNDNILGFSFKIKHLKWFSWLI